MRGRGGRFLLKLGLGAALALVLMHLPLGRLGPTAVALQMPLAVLLLVCFAGKLLYDTLFYDHYWP